MFTSDIPSADELVRKAFELAYFILGDRSAAIYVAIAAMDKLKAATSNQHRRLFYTPVGRARYVAARTKISLSKLHLLQRLVYIESELFERLLEGQQNTVSQADLIVRYIKHLTRITTKHNSFYVTLGLCRLLYNYSTVETSDVYNVLLQDPERTRDDYYYRSRKKYLMQLIKERFGSLLRTQRGIRGEERFQPQEDSQKYIELVKECLSRFTPWQSACVLPKVLDPNRNVITEFLFKGGNPDDEHVVELNRMHTIIHPNCLDRLLQSLVLARASERLDLPFFAVSGEGTSLPADRFKPSGLSEGELDAVLNYLNKHTLLRNSFPSRRVRLVVDGQTQGSFDLSEVRDLEFNIREGSELLEIRSDNTIEPEAESCLAAKLIEYDESGIIFQTSNSDFGRSQHLSLTITPLSGDSEGPQGAVLKISRQPKLARLGLESLRRLAVSPLPEKLLIARRPLLAGVLIATALMGFWLYLHFVYRSRSDPETRVATARPSPTVSANHGTQSDELIGLPSRRRIPQATSPSRPWSIGRTRGVNAKPVGMPLLAVKRVYVDPFGTDKFSEAFREDLTKALRRVGPLETVEDRDDADAVFKGGLMSTPESSATSVTVELVNPHGDVLWSFARKGTLTTVSENTADLANTISKMLLRDLKRSRKKHRP